MNEQANCSIVREKLPLYVGSDLDADGQDLVRSHLDVCSGCARDAAAAARSRDLFRAQLGLDASPASSETSAPANLWDGVRAELIRADLLSETSRESLRPDRNNDPRTHGTAAGRLLVGRFGGRLVGAAAAIVAVAFLGRMLGGNTPGEGGSQVPTPVVADGGGSQTLMVGSRSASEAGTLVRGESGLRPLLRQESDLLRDAQPLIYRLPAPSVGAGGAGQLAGYSTQKGAGGKRRLR